MRSELVPVGILSLLALIVVWIVFPLVSFCNARCNGLTFERALRQTYASVFQVIFPILTVTEREKLVKDQRNAQTDQPHRAQTKAQPEMPLVLFVGRHPNEEGPIPNEGPIPKKCCSCCEWLKLPWFWTYFYFAVVLTLALFWGIVVFWDNFWFKKTNTCNDINPGSDQYVCYEVHTSREFEVANCTALIGQDVDVLCFQDSQSVPTALGIGFSIFQFVLLIGKIGFVAASWFGSRGGGDSYACSHCFSGLTICSGIAVIIVLVAYAVSALTWLETDATHNLFFGHPPLRWWMYALVHKSLFCFLVLLGIISYMYHKNRKFQEVVAQELEVVVQKIEYIEQ